MLYLYLEAPFATFRSFTAGSFRPTAPFMTPSAAYGLLLNLAGIEMRRDDGANAMTLIADDVPALELALGAVDGLPTQHSLYQQLHNYPVGSSGKERAEQTKGSKYNIVPARRAFLGNLRACIAMRGDEALEQRVRDGVAGRLPRYGLPFLGDNSFLPDRIDPLEAPRPARWLVPVEEGAAVAAEGIGRYTVTIDRADMSRTRSLLMAPGERESDNVPDDAWIRVAYCSQ